MSGIFFNILVRTSGRPNYFKACISSIRRQSYQNFRVLVSYDDPDSYHYVKAYPDVHPVKVEKTQPRSFHRSVDPARQNPFIPNLYLNTLLNHVKEGFILFLDDDDCLLEKDALQIISDHVRSADDLVFWRVRLSNQRLIPSDANFGQAPVYTQINTAGFSFHSRYIEFAKWDGWRGGDYHVANKLYQKIPNKIYIDRALSGQQDQHNMAGLGLRIDKPVTMDEMRAQYRRMGYINPIRLLSRKEAHEFLEQALQPPRELPMDWEKGYAASSRFFYEMATHPAIVDRVSTLIGPNIILWGCSLIAIKPGGRHPWHCDIEASAPTNGRTINIWIGLKNISGHSGLSFIPLSHNFGKTVQQLRYENNLGRGQTNNAMILSWAQEVNPNIRIMTPDMSDGEALFFDGRMWHSSVNRTNDVRYALLVQYATPEVEIRMPDHNSFEWPFRQLSHPKPPVILQKGDDRFGVNRVVQAPVRQKSGNYQMTDNRIYPLKLPLPLQPDEKWRPFHIFNGTTANLQHLTCHVSVLSPGHSPHPPHTHREEEILIVLDGQADVILPEIESESIYKKRLCAGDFVYYPAHFQHTLEAAGAVPVHYLMLKWYNPLPSPIEKLPYGSFKCHAQDDSGKAIHYSLLFEGPTDCLSKLHCHTSLIKAGGGYAPHRDPYDVAIIVLEGKIETLGQVVDTHHVIFYPAGTLHGISNPTQETARYLVFEFHGRQGLGYKQVKPKVADLQVTPMNQSEAKSEQYEQLLQEYQAIESSYSLRFGRAITRMTGKYLGWLPFVRKAIDRSS